MKNGIGCSCQQVMHVTREVVVPNTFALLIPKATKWLQVSAMMKKHLVEGLVPVLIELKRSLEGQRHWLLGDLLTCVSALLKDHKHEVCPAAPPSSGSRGVHNRS